MVKTLVTHINPHLDDIAAIWLFKRFHGEFKVAKIKFISAEKGHQGLKDTDNIIHFGVGRGKFDEHTPEKVGESAMSLVWKDIQKNGLGPKDEFEKKAMEEMVRWNTLIDTAKIPSGEFEDFAVASFIRPYTGLAKDSLVAQKLGEQILDRILLVLIKKQKALLDWEKRVEFETRWGKGAAVQSKYVRQGLAYKSGFKILIVKDPQNENLAITAPPTTDIDLTSVYLKLSAVDPEAGWFLHQAKRMVNCGASSAPEAKKTKLSLDKIIEIVKQI